MVLSRDCDIQPDEKNKVSWCSWLNQTSSWLRALLVSAMTTSSILFKIIGLDRGCCRLILVRK
ncbi:hypothetical protein HanXRQr2_Chr13g0611111 [Helianthus annuus]|uniref:Uncharacterized protein n=1 Tax=Helianthus annuus TaxID=4232 RepID=A0A9K3EL69_HELAN|nr:hypothetical protein HanXRQr2_Chr13g0611111 [Helianthus annuus]KAJ0483293.1 hypothetical protein HanIR_Chr13g0663251 [Helianthus annuus]